MDRFKKGMLDDFELMGISFGFPGTIWTPNLAVQSTIKMTEFSFVSRFHFYDFAQFAMKAIFSSIVSFGLVIPATTR
jgi:hypothetical protein